MNSLWYVFSRDAKNKLLELKRKPGKLVMYLLVIAVLVTVIVISITQEPATGNIADIMWLKGIVIALFMFTVYAAISQGLKKGTTLFQMEDVNFLFVSPLNSRKILLFGVIRMMKASLLSSLFILFNSSTLRTFFGVEFSGMLMIFAAFVLVTAVSQLLTLVIYSMTNGRKRRQTFVKYAIGILFIPVAIGIVRHIVGAGMDVPAGLLDFLHSPISSYTPIAGWAATGAVAFITGQYAMGAFFFGLLAVVGIALVAVIYIGNPDYYEDVLVATETAFEKARDIADGKIEAATTSDKEIKVKNTGVGGIGASALFYRHLRESFRVNKFGLWGISTLVLTGLAIAYSLLMRQVGYEGGNHMITMLVIVMFMQIFLIGTGRGVKDQYNHYIYMIPENPFNKLLWSNLEAFLKIAVQNALMFISAGIVMGTDVTFIALSIITCTLFAFVILSISFLSMRFTGAHMSMGILSMIYMSAIVIVMIPGLAGAIIVAVMFGDAGLFLALAILSAWELAVGVVCFYAAKGVLHDCDIPSLTGRTNT